MKMPCPNCSKTLALDDAWAGKVVKCPACRGKFIVPQSRSMAIPPDPGPIIGEVVDEVEPLQEGVVEIQDVIPLKPARRDDDIPEVLAADVAEVIPVGLDRDGPEGVAYCRGTRFQGLSLQQGIVVLRPDYVAFLPTHRPMNLGLSMFGHFVGIVTIELGRKGKRPSEKLISELWYDARDDFDAALRDTVRDCGGAVWPRTGVLVSRPYSISSNRNLRLAFTMGKVNRVHSQIMITPPPTYLFGPPQLALLAA
jgi:DNA-directed RNA polymerase subunit RPC12/RpoP